jgi:hypothetical protein
MSKTPERMEEEMGEVKSIGFMYLAKKECGRVAAMCWDEPKYAKDTAKHVADYIRRGLTVERMERFEGDALPEMICKECRGKPCAKATGA